MVEVLFREQRVLNNTIISVSDIGDEIVDSLVCITGGVLGQWLLPDGTEPDLSRGVFTTQGPGFVALGRSGSAEVDSGLFSCEVPEKNVTIFVGIYSNDTTTGKSLANFQKCNCFVVVVVVVVVVVLHVGQPMLTSIMHDARAAQLTCVSTGGPASSVTWERNGVETPISRSQFVADSANATYSNTLQLDGPPASVIGTYSCQVMNQRGRSEVLTLELKG